MLKSKAMAKPAAADKTAVAKHKNETNAKVRLGLYDSAKIKNNKNKAEAKKG